MSRSRTTDQVLLWICVAGAVFPLTAIPAALIGQPHRWFLALAFLAQSAAFATGVRYFAGRRRAARSAQ